MVFRKSVKRLTQVVKKMQLAMISLFRPITNRFKKDYSGNGERQASKSLEGIRRDHVNRYKFSCKYINDNDIVLDCACGVGYGSFILAKETELSSIIAIDIDEQAISFAKKHYNNDKIVYKAGDIFSLDLPDEYFDCIVSFETLEHVDGSALLELFYNKLKKNGLLVVSTPNQVTMLFTKERFPFHLRHYTPLEYHKLLTSNGFKILKKFTQHDIDEGVVKEGWDGLFNIAVSKKSLDDEYGQFKDLSSR